MSTVQVLTLAAAVALDPDVWDDLSILDRDFDADTRDRSARVWLRLCGVGPTSPDADSVRDEVLGNGGLMVAVNLPAAEFLPWFRRADWRCFNNTERTGGEAWAWEALQRARSACDAMGVMSTQCSLGAPT